MERCIKFAEHIKGLGFRVFLSKSKTYGFITDQKGERVLSFSFSGLQDTLSGNYGPPSTTSVTGWRLSTWRLSTLPAHLQIRSDVVKALNASPDFNVGKGWKYFQSLDQHLAMYGSSSGYEEI